MTPPDRTRHPRRQLAGLALAAALVAGCSTTPGDATEPPPLEQLLLQADAARAQGDRQRARQQWQDAARLHPVSAQPWRMLAEDHFKAGENGSAIVAAQEAARRDPQDRVAQSILAVGGLRVSSTALVALRERDGVPEDARGEAVELTRLLRETLGVPVLVPPPEPPPPVKPRRGARPASAARPAGTAPVTAGGPVQGAGAAPAAVVTAASVARPAATAGSVSPAPKPVAASTVAATVRPVLTGDRPEPAFPPVRPAPAPALPPATPGPARAAVAPLPPADPFDRLR